MTDGEIAYIKRKARQERGIIAPSQTKRARRKAKLKMRFRSRLPQEIADTAEKLELLKEIQAEANA